MCLLNSNIKNQIISSIKNIININESSWNELDKNLKTKIIHHYCNIFNNSNDKNNIDWDIISIPLKSIKPKKFIQIYGINKNNHKKLFNDYLDKIQKYTICFRNKFCIKDKKYFIYSNLPKNEYNNILNNYNEILYNFITENKKNIDICKFYNNIIGSNNNKIICSDKPVEFDIKIINNKIEIIFNNNINILLELVFDSDKITNNIPVKYIVKLTNIL